MTSRKRTTKSAASKSRKPTSIKKESTPMPPIPATSTTSAAAPETSAPPATSQPAPAHAATATSGTSLAFPPADANIPVPPEGAIATNGSDYNGLQPRKSEQAALPAAIVDLQRFPNYAVLLAVTALPQAHVIEMLQLGLAWTSMRNKSSAWDAFCRTQEGLA